MGQRRNVSAERGGWSRGESRAPGWAAGKALASAGALLVFLAAVGALPAQAFEQRPGTFSLGLQGGAGVYSGTGTYVIKPYDPTVDEHAYPYDTYDWGGSLAIRLRYCLDPEHAVGVSMEDLRFQRRSGQVDQVDLGSRVEHYSKQLQVNNYMGEYYLYLSPGRMGFLGDLGRRYKNSPYGVAGIGIHRDTFRSGTSDATIAPFGFVVAAGLGWEYFVRRPFSIDASVRGYYMKSSGGSGTAAEAQLGFQYYLLR
jgi:hypothetical protein